MNKILRSLTGHTSSHTPNLDEVLSYVKASAVLAQKGTKCVDGRYLPSQSHGMIARPGADCGYVMALEAVNRKKNLGLTPEECFNAIFKAVKKLHGTFYLHTDEHAISKNGFIGCGHLAKAARPGFSWEYDIRSRDVREMVAYAQNLSEVTTGIEMINLLGEHREKGVLLIHSKKFTVLAANPKRHEMYFIYDVDRDHSFMRAVVEEMDLKGVTFEDILHEADLQLEATLQNLALHLPIYDVTFRDDQAEVAYVSSVQPKSFIRRLHMPPYSSLRFFTSRV